MGNIEQGVYGIVPGSTMYTAERSFSGGCSTITGLVVVIERDQHTEEVVVKTLEEGTDKALRENQYPLAAFLDGKCGGAIITTDLDGKEQKPAGLSGLLQFERFVERLKK